MEGRELQHHKNVNIDKDKSQYDCSSEERTRFQYRLHNSEVLGQFLVQRQLGGQQHL